MAWSEWEKLVLSELERQKDDIKELRELIHEHTHSHYKLQGDVERWKIKTGFLATMGGAITALAAELSRLVVKHS